MSLLMGKADPEHLKLGCPLNNLTQEMSPIDEGFNIRLQAALRLWVDETDRHLKRAKKNGYIKKKVNTKQVAYFIVMSYEGFYGMMKSLMNLKLFPHSILC